MFCMNCGLELPEDAKFCRKCASPLTSCPECGEDIPKRAKYCWKCGKSLATVSVSSGLKEPEEPASLLDEPESDPENVLPAKSDNASIFARMSSAKSAEASHQNGAPSPFKQSAGAKRESSASAYSPAGMPSAFKPASEKKKKENEKPDQPAPSPYNRFAEAASPFKPLGSAKKESAPSVSATPSRPAAPRGAASVGGSRPAAPRGAAAVAGSRPAAPRGAAAVAGSRPAASLRPEAQEVKEEPARSASPASPFKPVSSAKAPSRPAAPRGAASVGGSRPAAPRGASAVAGTRPAASAPRAALRPAAQAQVAAKEEPANEAPAAAPSGPFKPFAPAKTAAPAKPSAAANSAFKPSVQNTAKEEPAIGNEAPAEPLRPSPPVTFVPSGLFKPLASPEEPKETPAPQAPSPFASSMTSSPFASGSAFSPLTSSEPDLEVPKKSFGFTAYRPGMSSSESKDEDKKPVNPTAMFHMNSNSGAMSSLGGDDLGSLSSLGSPDAGSLISDGFEDSDEKLPQRGDEDHPRFFRRTAPAPAPETAPEPTHVPDMKFNLPKAEPMKPKAFSSSNPSPFRSVLNAGTDDEKPVEREPGASPFKPLRT